MLGVHQEILARFRTLRALDIDKVSEVGTRVLIPIFESSLLIRLIDESIYLLQKQPILVSVTSPVIVVGDLHGSLHDLLRILKFGGNPPDSRYIFLGDYIDRGPLSLEVITLLAALYCEYPDSITLLRGNHEFKSTITKYGFKDEIKSVYNDMTIFDAYHRLFTYFPLAAVVNDNIFCVHGGISPILYNINQISNLKKPIIDENTDLVVHLLWADPSKSFNHFSVSGRGRGVTFGEGAASNFFSYSGMSKIIRGHQCVNGFEYSLNDKCITVFSSSSYDSQNTNSSGIIYITENSAIEPKSFPPIEKYERNKYRFFKFLVDASIRKPINLQTQFGLGSGPSFYTSPNKRPVVKQITNTNSRKSLILRQIIPNFY